VAPPDDQLQTQQLPQEKLAEELDEVEEDFKDLQVLYEKYFLGIDRKPPDDQRKSVGRRIRLMRTTTVKNTALKFHINTMFAKLLSYERMWDRTLREMEEGTYRRDVFKAKIRARKLAQHEDDVEIVEEAAPPQPTIELSDEKLRRIYDTFLLARRRTGEPTEGITFLSIAEKLRAQVPMLIEQYGAKSVEFKVVIKDGKAVLKAVPHT
jgi:hypothetical protein